MYSYKPGLPIPSCEDDFFSRDGSAPALPDEEEREKMLKLAAAFLKIDPGILSADYSIITNEGLPVFKQINLSYRSWGRLEISIFGDFIQYSVFEDYGDANQIFNVVTRCQVAAGIIAGYFAERMIPWGYCEVCDERLDDPWDPLTDEASAAVVMALIDEGKDPAPGKNQKRPWWKFGTRQRSASSMK